MPLWAKSPKGTWKFTCTKRCEDRDGRKDPEITKLLGSETWLRILQWLKAANQNFPPPSCEGTGSAARAFRRRRTGLLTFPRWGK